MWIEGFFNLIGYFNEGRTEEGQCTYKQQGKRDSTLKTVHQSLQQYSKGSYPSMTAQTSQLKSPLASANIIFSISSRKLLHCRAALSLTRGQEDSLPNACSSSTTLGWAWQSPIQKLPAWQLFAYATQQVYKLTSRWRSISKSSTFFSFPPSATLLGLVSQRPMRQSNGRNIFVFYTQHNFAACKKLCP